MIYEFGREIVHCCKSIRHFFRAMFCKNYYVESHPIGMCEAEGCFCEYWRCPRQKGADDERHREKEAGE